MILIDVLSSCLEIAKNYGMSGIMGTICIIIVYWLFTKSNEKTKNDYINSFKEVNDSNMTALKNLMNDQHEFLLDNNKQILHLVETSIKNNTQKNHDDHEEALTNRMNISNQINDIIEKTRLLVNADRAFIIELHNSGLNLNGNPFAHFSVNFESIDRGLAPLSGKYTSMPYSIISNTCTDIYHQRIIRINNVNDLDGKHSAVREYLLLEGIHSVIVSGVCNSHNKLTGLFVLCFNTKITDHCSDGTILDASAQISALLNVKNT